jgi:hypothetical protein
MLPLHVKFVMDKVASGQIFLGVLQFPPGSTIPPILHTLNHLRVALTGRTNGRGLRNSVSNALL